MRVTTKSIHDELQRQGHDVHLEKGDGYFYFRGTEPNDWLDKTVKVSTLGSLTLEQWVAEYLRLKKLNAELSGGANPASARSKKKQKSERNSGA